MPTADVSEWGVWFCGDDTERAGWCYRDDGTIGPMTRDEAEQALRKAMSGAWVSRDVPPVYEIRPWDPTVGMEEE